MDEFIGSLMVANRYLVTLRPRAKSRPKDGSETDKHSATLTKGTVGAGGSGPVLQFGWLHHSMCIDIARFWLVGNRGLSGIITKKNG